ncbi:hypothetical protein PMAYCL1PPCAC_11197, partial [Pristionchus mayeri]
SSAIQLLSDFPNSTHSIILRFTPDQTQLLSIPPLDTLTISTYICEISSDLFFKLLATHKNLKLDRNPIEILSEGWLEVLQMLSADSRGRTVEVTVRSSSIVECLKECGITEFSEVGSNCRQFEILRSVPASPRNSSSLQLRFKKCSLTIEHLAWTC